MNLPKTTPRMMMRTWKPSGCVHRAGRSVTALLALLVVAPHSLGQTFTSGSTGADGPLVVNGNVTLPMPPDGVFHFTTITVNGNGILRFTPNAANTPVYLLATGDVNIHGSISVNGSGGTPSAGGVPGPGGYRGGSPGGAGVPAGPGHGPGGGLPGEGGNTEATAGGGSYGVRGATVTSRRGPIYGSPILFPIVGGSGGGGTHGTPGQGGGGGGGALLIASSTRIQMSLPAGRLEARGGGSAGGAPGSGGAIRLVAPVVTGGGAIEVTGGGFGSGAGRIRIDAHDRSGIAFSYSPTSAVSTGAFLAVEPDPKPRIDFIEAAGQTIAPGTDVVLLTLPQGAPTTQPVRLRISNFDAVVPIRVTALPDHGDPIVVDIEVDNRGPGGAVETTVQLTLPVNDQVSLYAFSR